MRTQLKEVRRGTHYTTEENAEGVEERDTTEDKAERKQSDNTSIGSIAYVGGEDRDMNTCNNNAEELARDMDDDTTAREESPAIMNDYSPREDKDVSETRTEGEERDMNDNITTEDMYVSGARTEGEKRDMNDNRSEQKGYDMKDDSTERDDNHLNYFH